MPIRPIEIMEKHFYDPNKDGLIAVAQLESEVCTEGEADTKVSVHKSDASAHHAKTGHNEVYGLLTAGLAADRPAASIAGRFYFSTDTLILQRDNGTAWDEIARGETTIRLAQLSEKAHSSLTGIGASDHHIKTTSFADITDRAGVSKLNWGAGKLLKGAGAGVDPTEIDVPAGATIVRKTADEIVNNSTTLQNDDHLLLSAGANETWFLEFFLLNSSVTTTPSITLCIIAPSGADGKWMALRQTNIVAAESIGSAIGFGSPVLAYIPYWLSAVVRIGATAGNIQLQWAQNTATAEDTKLLMGSCLIAHKIA